MLEVEGKRHKSDNPSSSPRALLQSWSFGLLSTRLDSSLQIGSDFTNAEAGIFNPDSMLILCANSRLDQHR
jgi:hypothetical protein